jgi:hypothetical protein
VVTISLRCAGGPCTGTAKLTYKGKSIGSARYSIGAGKTGRVKITLNAAGKKQLKNHNDKLTVKLVIAPASGTPRSTSITLKAPS